MATTSLCIDTGVLQVPVVRDGKKAGMLTLYPEDTAFLTRFQGLLPRLEQRRADLAEALQGADAAVTLAAVDAACTEVRTAIDEVFGPGTCALVFGEVCSLDMVRQFFTGVAGVLEQARAPKLAAYTQADGTGALT